MRATAQPVTEASASLSMVVSVSPATADRPLSAGVARTRERISEAIAGRFATDVTARTETVLGMPGVRVDVTADVPALGLWGPAVHLVVSGHAVEEAVP